MDSRVKPRESNHLLVAAEVAMIPKLCEKGHCCFHGDPYFPLDLGSPWEYP
jgi:hypothetical protein